MNSHLKYLIFLAVFTTSFCALAQDSTSNNHFPKGIWSQGGMVGIGTKVPSSLLTLKGINNNQVFEIEAFNNTNKILYFNTSSSFPYLYLNKPDGATAISLNTNGKSYFKGGWLGIGKEPMTDLHISSGLSGDAILRIEADEDNNQEGDNPRIQFVQDGGLIESSIGHGVTSSSPNQNVLDINNSVVSGGINLSIGGANGVGANSALFIDTDKNIGIGTITPRTRLDVIGGGWFSSLTPTQWFTNLRLGNFWDVPHIPGLEILSKDMFGQGYFKNLARRWGANFYWNRGSSEGERTAMLLSSTSGSTNLSLFNQDSLRAFSLSVDNSNATMNMSSNGNGNFQGSYFYMKAGEVQSGDNFNQTLITTNRMTIGAAYWGIQRRLNHAYKGDLLQYTDLYGWRFFTALNRSSTGTVEALRITPSGEIGIGTTTVPTGYKLAIAGHAIAEKMVIRKNGNWPDWPDYVFGDDYKLPKLSDTEAYVKKHKHLPEIPSAADIEENGQDLAEMNKLLLKKVEELTLYVIELQKDNDLMKKEIQNINSQLR